MEVVKTIIAVVLVLVCVALIAVVSLQSGKENGLSTALAGGSKENYMSKSGGDKSILTKSTKWLALGFVVLVLALNIL